MPERKRLIPRSDDFCSFAAVVVAPVQGRARKRKKWPRKTGAISWGGTLAGLCGCGRGRSTAAALEIRGRNREGRRCVSRCGRAPSAGDRGRHHSIEQAGGRCDGK